MTTAFVDGATRMAAALGVSGYPFAVIDHPISSASEQALVRRARRTLEQAETLLGLTRQGSSSHARLEGGEGRGGESLPTEGR